MSVYIGLEFLIVLFGLLAQYNNVKVNSNGEYDRENNYKNRYSIFYLFLFFSLFIVSAFRYYNGSDYGSYVRREYTFQKVVSFFKEFNEPISKFIIYISRVIYDSGFSVIILFSLLTLIFVFKGIKNYDNNEITMMLLIYYLAAGWISSLGAIRQSLAVAFIFATLNLNSRSKNYIVRCVIICFIAFLIHRSAFLMLPILLLANRRTDFKQILLIIFLAAVLPYFTDWAYEFMEIDFDEIAESAQAYFTNTINPIRIVVSFAPLVLLLFLEDRQSFIEENSFFINMALINALLTLSTSSSAYMNRFTQFTNIYLAIFIAKALKYNSKNMRLLLTIVTIVLYSVYFYIEIKNSSNLNPYKWCFPYWGTI